MKNKNIHILCGLILTVIFAMTGRLTAQNGWYPLQSGTENLLKSVYFTDVNTGYMAGNGIVLKTLNGGRNWLVISTLYSGNSIDFINQYTGYICEGSIIKTTNGGVSFTNLGESSLISVSFPDANTGYGVGYNSKIVKTTNGGQSFDLQFINMYGNKLNTVYFINPNTGFVAGGKMTSPYSAVIYKTVNGGISWYDVSPSTSDIDFRSIHFPSDSIGYAVGGYEYASSGVIYKTTNKG